MNSLPLWSTNTKGFYRAHATFERDIRRWPVFPWTSHQGRLRVFLAVKGCGASKCLAFYSEPTLSPIVKC